ncbi:40S ribosomal protein S3A, putative [Trypanosoma brucei gambiense DAL972]|uniref:Small ribosomal subunit protein eS1 n=3 Tax=Trypanosoma brucei TaxID=5691 RepID=Q38BK6_TRYB2|nr:40S ribosomal protein S3A, putative [Trypanosoma brucei gambiense DAL972]XP_011777669.1 40S ribosomal protein S3A, putative [Trypanosoma brucei gambiense DAL972]XP_822642.1 40S ribosomal protein S3a, putative [Trypanosoma brucei brucei TREU927]4V8M_A0 Chain A0, 40S RIBOSOMAL PROTEIN S3A, PUTATIVE [Trypanosoma brucei brucei TREU927]8OVA_A0 Chain A0, 40S ribosomal protein S3a [Trypanosoma brucei brucei]8OVE_A0 Chain A0, 40S ribosomal protein S3a [Trypanosoma brucei brucei]RHW68614.1 40S ribo|eukprot:XP_011777668.1 40S ribosomal protein S3A, putative [Trypanosoma brucei gambiense DAL972]
MTLGKNKRISKGGKRGKKKAQEAMSRKEWYDVVAPKNFEVRQFAKTICNKTQGTKIAADFLRGRVYEGNLADLNKTQNEDDAYRKVKFTVQEVQGRNLLTQFHGMDMTSDRVYYLLRKWCTTIEATVEAKTADGYGLRLFLIAFTKKQENQLSKNCYAKTRLVKWVRMRATNIIRRRLAKLDINDAVSLLTRNILRDRLAKRCNPIIPLRDLRIRKVKVIRTPKFDAQALIAAHGEVPTSAEGEARVVEEAQEETA